MDYINLLDGNLLLKVIGLAVLTIVIMAVIHAVSDVEMMGEDE